MTYALSRPNFVINHGFKMPRLLRDISEQPTPLDIESLVASGDLFAVLGTELDDILNSLIETSSAGSTPKLEKLTDILFYLQRHYRVVHKQ